MRKTVLSFFAAILSLVSVDAQVLNLNVNPELVITIKPLKPKKPYNPFSLVASDVEAYYSNEALTLIFNKDLGDADIVVTNLTTGDIWNDSVSGACSATIILSGEEGCYQIAIYSDDGDYSGEFTL